MEDSPRSNGNGNQPVKEKGSALVWFGSLVLGMASTHTAVLSFTNLKTGVMLFLLEASLVVSILAAVKVVKEYFRGGADWWYNVQYSFKWWTGVALTTNFLFFWGIPIFGQGQLWKLVLRYPFHPIYQMLYESKMLRRFASQFIYSKPVYADYFVQAVMITIGFALSFGYVFYYQITFGHLPAWLIFAYYCSWVGFGGRVMGGAYTFAHKEGHNKMMYKPWIRNTIGNFFENWLGPWFGNVPYNFTTSHIAIHHRLNAGKGDTFYQWDLDRSSWSDLMIFLHRILMHTTALSSLQFFKERDMKRHYDTLLRGTIVYWFIIPPILLYATNWSWSFLFYIYLQPFLCMTYFLAFMNFGFHGFIENDDKGESIWCVNSTCIVEGDDDYFGEDDHMSHHHATSVYWSLLDEHRQKKKEEFKKYKASVFRGLSIVELSMFLLLKDWKRLADHYVDYSGSLDKQQVCSMLEERAHRLEMTHKDYVQWVNTQGWKDEAKSQDNKKGE